MGKHSFEDKDSGVNVFPSSGGYRQEMVYARKYEIPAGVQEQIEFAKSLGSRAGFCIQHGLGNAITCLNWYVVKPDGRRWYEFAPGCIKPIGFDAGGFEKLADAIACFEKIED